MQKRRREEHIIAEETQRDILIPATHWHTLRERDPAFVQRSSGAMVTEYGDLHLVVLEQTIRVSPDSEQVDRRIGEQWLPTPRLLAFVSVVYLVSAQASHLSGQWVSEKDLSCAAFFRGPHALPVERLLERFAEDPAGLVSAAERVGGLATNDPGDAVVRLWVFPKVPVKVSLWRGDEELPAGVGILFDRSIEHYLPADAIWAMVHLLIDTLVEATAQ